MPLFDFKCTRCHLVTELMLTYDESKEPQECPRCHSPSEKETPIFSKQSVNWSAWNRNK